MKKGEILKKRRELSQQAGKSEYFFFTSILLSAVAFCAIAVLATDLFMKTPEVAAAYGDFFGNTVSVAPVNNPFFEAAATVLENTARAAIEAAPAALVFMLTLILVVCPIYQGTIRWSAYLTEEHSALPIRAIMFYFLSPSLYFSSVLLSLRIFLRKALAAALFLLPPMFCFGLSLILGSDYYGQKTLAGGSLILSVVWFTLAVVLYMIFCQRYAAVRYLYALGAKKKIFRRSAEVTRERRVWFFTFQLRLLPNLLLFAAVVTAPLALSRILCARSLAVKALISEKRSAA